MGARDLTFVKDERWTFVKDECWQEAEMEEGTFQLSNRPNQPILGCMPGTPNSALPEGNLGHSWDAPAGSSGSSTHLPTPGRPSNAITSFSRSSLSSTSLGHDQATLLAGTIDESSLQSVSESSITEVRRRSDHSGRIYKALLILAIVVTAISLVPGSNDSDDTISNQPISEQGVDAGSPDAPPPDVLIQRD